MYPISYFQKAVSHWPNRIAVRDARIAMMFAELEAHVRACAAAFNAIDPDPVSRVGICAANSIDHIVSLLAVLACGKTWVPLSPTNGNGELARIVQFTEPSIIVQDDAAGGRFDTRIAKVIGITNGETTLQFLMDRHRGAPWPSIQRPLNDPQAIKFTGGTTGDPKGVMQSFRNWNAMIATQLDCFGFTCDDKYLAAAPLTHGTSTFLLPVLSQGGCFVCPESTKAPQILDSIATHGITSLFMPPTLIYGVVSEQRRHPRDTRSLRRLIYTAAPMPAEKIAEAQAVFGPVVATTYGQTEAPIVATFLSSQEMTDPNLAASVGRPTLLSEVSIQGENGAMRPAGEIGEVALRGDLTTTGYWRRPDLTAKLFRKGWLLTGDLGLLDEQGYLFLKGRTRDVIITGGFNVYPADVEAVLFRHPAVLDGAVLGIADEKWGEAVHAAIVLRDGEAVSEDELIRFVKVELGSVKAPKAVHFIAELPRNSLGKIVKTELTRRIAEALKVKRGLSDDTPEKLQHA